jgi:hypothetical protein
MSHHNKKKKRTKKKKKSKKRNKEGWRERVKALALKARGA